MLTSLGLTCTAPLLPRPTPRSRPRRPAPAPSGPYSPSPAPAAAAGARIRIPAAACCSCGTAAARRCTAACVLPKRSTMPLGISARYVPRQKLHATAVFLALPAFRVPLSASTEFRRDFLTWCAGPDSSPSAFSVCRFSGLSASSAPSFSPLGHNFSATDAEIRFGGGTYASCRLP